VGLGSVISSLQSLWYCQCDTLAYTKVLVYCYAQNIIPLRSYTNEAEAVWCLLWNTLLLIAMECGVPWRGCWAPRNVVPQLYKQQISERSPRFVCLHAADGCHMNSRLVPNHH
jgi:hypothetical protein